MRPGRGGVVELDGEQRGAGRRGRCALLRLAGGSPSVVAGGAPAGAARRQGGRHRGGQQRRRRRGAPTARPSVPDHLPTASCPATPSCPSPLAVAPIVQVTPAPRPRHRPQTAHDHGQVEQPQHRHRAGHRRHHQATAVAATTTTGTNAHCSPRNRRTPSKVSQVAANPPARITQPATAVRTETWRVRPYSARRWRPTTPSAPPMPTAARPVDWFPSGAIGRPDLPCGSAVTPAKTPGGARGVPGTEFTHSRRLTGDRS
ncbi:hypothetical protein SVIOM74S_06788 [Streptomyces violarus]